MSEAKRDENPAARCFFITPIGSAGSAERKRADWIFRFLTEVCGDLNLAVERADRMSGSPMITARIFGAVTDAAICVADLSGLNANVFYELGIRHAVRKPVVHIAENGTTLPFDNAQHDTHFYDLSDVHSTDQLKKTLREQITSMLGTGYAVSNPLTAALGVIEVASSGDPKDQFLTQLNERLISLEAKLALGGRTVEYEFQSRDDATAVLRAFVASKDLRSDYSPETLARALDIAMPEYSLYDAVGKAILTGNRGNKSDLKAVFDQHIPF